MRAKCFCINAVQGLMGTLHSLPPGASTLAFVLAYPNLVDGIS